MIVLHCKWCKGQTKCFGHGFLLVTAEKRLIVCVITTSPFFLQHPRPIRDPFHASKPPVRTTGPVSWQTANAVRLYTHVSFPHPIRGIDRKQKRILFDQQTDLEVFFKWYVVTSGRMHSPEIMMATSNHVTGNWESTLNRRARTELWYKATQRRRWCQRTDVDDWTIFLTDC